MAYLTALVPVAQGVAAYAALTRHADTLKSSGDERSKGAIMADELSSASPAPRPATPASTSNSS
jgi:hypothetical protein